MESSRSFTNFSQLRNVLDNSTPQQDVGQNASLTGQAVTAPAAFSTAFGQSKEFPTALSSAHNYSQNRRSMRMDELVQDLNSALDESTSGLRPKRKVWRRRCKSTSNLAVIINRGQGSGPPGRSQNNSIDETSTSSEEEMVEDGLATGQLLEVISGDRKDDRGTSSLQVSDSDETCSVNNLSSNPVDQRVDNQVVSKRLTPHYSSTVRKKRASSLQEKGKEQLEFMASQEPISTGQKRDRYVAGLHSVSPEKNLVNAALESDSLNENFSPFRPNTKRKRKCKRIALDPESASGFQKGSKAKSSTPSSCDKRKKMRSRSACTNLQPATGSSSRYYFACPHQPPLSVTGKRKRSNREKSVETDGSNCQKPDVATDKEMMDFEIEGSEIRTHRGVGSSSSLSSSDWEDASDAEERISQPEIDAHEADDEQSDWPGHADDAGGTIYGPSDDEFETRNMIDDQNLDSLTSTAKQAYFARMKRLAECVPGREIRAGARRLRTRQRGFTIKSSSSEQVSRFLQDSRRTELRLTVIRPSDRNKIAHLANLYSLSIRHEGITPSNIDGQPGSYLIVLTKTGRTLKVNEEFIVPGAPSSKPSSYPTTEVKRRRREILTDANPTEAVEFVSLNPVPKLGGEKMILEHQSSPTSSTSTNEPHESPVVHMSSFYHGKN